MNLITESKLKEYRNSTRYYLKPIRERLVNFKNEPKQSRITIFLSHKHDELEILDVAIIFLKEKGVDVYVDWLDEGMPKGTSGRTAVTIKKRINENRKFILLATEGAISSKWCNWELGFGDAAKYIDHIAILPIKKDNIDFSGSEYLEIYPYIINIDTSQYINNIYKSPGTYVVYPSVSEINKVIPITDWLKI